MRNQVYKKIVSFFIVCSLVFITVNPIFAVEYTTKELVGSEKIQESVYVGDTSNNEEVFKSLTNGTKILDYVHDSVFRQNKHVARLTDEEKLYNYVFLNSDGSRTAYHMDEEVKFRDTDGVIKEKDLTLVSSRNGYDTLLNDIELSLPMKPSNGISLSYRDYDVRIIPEGGSPTVVASLANNKITYQNYYGIGTSLVYTPTLSGVKEDIVLQKYTGINEFSFLLETGGLELFENNGEYYLAENDSSDRRVELGDVVAYDSAGHFSLGYMSVDTIIEKETYRITLHVNEEFLLNPNTAYPVWVDPTLTISDNTHGAGAIEDITIYSGVPTMNCNWQYLVTGYLDSSFGVGRTLVKMPSLIEDSTYQTLGAGAITSAYFYIYEASGSTAYPINLYANTGSSNWTESTATWNNSGWALGTQYATTSPASSSFASFNITNLVKAWLRASEDANAGFILMSSNETSMNKSFCSTEFTNSACWPYVVVNYETSGSGGGSGFAGASTLTLGTLTDVQVTVIDEKRYFKFTPTTTGFYNFESTNANCDPRIWLYNQNQVLMRMQNDPSGYTNFDLTYHLVAGKIYYIVVGCTGTDTGTYQFSVTHATADDLNVGLSISVDTVKTVDIDVGYTTKNYYFIPSTSGTYVILSNKTSGDPMIWIYNSNLSLMKHDDDSGHGLDFCTNATLTAGQKYYIVVSHSIGRTGEYDFHILPEGRLPTSGSEIDFDPSEWSPRLQFEAGNCYAYMLNNHINNYVEIYGIDDIGIEPGAFIRTSRLETNEVNPEDIVAFVNDDAENMGFYFVPIGKYDICPIGTYKVALAIDLHKDYHFYRQNPDGTWSHKIRNHLPTNLDPSGNVIYDPQNSDRNFVDINTANYDIFVGFFYVSPWDGQLVTDEYAQ